MTLFLVLDDTNPIEAMLNRFFDFNITGPVISSLCVMLIVAVLAPVCSTMSSYVWPALSILATSSRCDMDLSSLIVQISSKN